MQISETNWQYVNVGTGNEWHTEHAQTIIWTYRERDADMHHQALYNNSLKDLMIFPKLCYMV